MRPRCSVLTGGFDFSGCGDCTSCPPVERAEMSNSEPSAIVLQGIPRICGLYKFRFEWRKRRVALFKPVFGLSGAVPIRFWLSEEEVLLNWNKWIRQTHRWVSMAFT